MNFCNENKRLMTAFIFVATLILMPSMTHARCLKIGKRQVAQTLKVPQHMGVLSIEAADCSHLHIENETIAFILRPDTKKVNNGTRTEVAINYPFKELDRVSYQFDLKIPKGFKADAPKNRWWAIAQWHDQPNREKGETWKGFRGVPPPLAVYLEERNGDVGIGLMTTDSKKESWFPFPLGDWLTLNITIDWSSRQNGAVDFKVLNHPEFSYKAHGRNMNNTYQHYLKIGQYRHPEIKTNTQVIFRNLSITKQEKR